MPLRTILVPLTAGVDSAPCLDAARQVGAHVEALVVRADAASTISLLGDAAAAADTILAEFERVVAGSMVLLRKAEHVSVFTARSREEADADPGADLVEALRWHGIAARRLGPAAGAASVGEAPLGAAAGAGATRVVMGAYTHSRVREMFLGGVTRHVLAHATLPVIMAH